MNFREYFGYRMVLETAWSLALELTFYIVFPFILIWRQRVLFGGVSFVIFLAAYCAYLDTDRFGYRLLPGTLFIFFCGSWIKSANGRPADIILPAALWLLATVLIVNTYAFPSLGLLSFNRSVLFGIVIGIPILFALDVTKFSPPFDELAGNLSYGVFLNQLMLVPVLEHFIGREMNTSADVVIACAAATILSFISFTYIATRPACRTRPKCRFPTRSP